MGSAAKHRRKRARTAEGAVQNGKEKTASSQENANPSANTKAMLQIQECSFVHLDVSGITAVATSRGGNMFAVARVDGTIELRQKDLLWAVSSVLHNDGNDPDSFFNSLCFTECSRYIFAAKLDGSLSIFRVNAQGLAEHVRLNPGGGAIWDLAVSRHGAPKRMQVAAACDDGCVRFIEADPSFTTYAIVNGTELPDLPTESTHYIVKISETTNARALSVAWSPPVADSTVQCVVCGDSEGGLRWLNPEDGSLYGRGKIPSIRRDQAMIWNVLFVSQGKYVVCGDSRGMATVWSSATNTVHQEVQIEGLEGTIWSSALVGEGTATETVFFGSADGGVGGLQSLPSFGDSDRWLPLRSCHFHSHDVRGMACFPNGTVVSGSMDARLCVFDVPIFVDRKNIQWVLPYHGCAGQSPIQFNTTGNLIVSRRERSIEIWQIHDDDSQAPALRLRMSLKSISSNIISCSTSSDCTRVSVASADAFRLYKVWDGEGTIQNTSSFGKVVSITVSRAIEAALRGSIDMGFCREDLLVAITRCRQKIAVLHEGELRIWRKDQIGAKGDFLDRIACSRNNVALSDSEGNVLYAPVSTLTTVDETARWKLVQFGRDKSSHRVSALCISQSGSKLAIARNDFSVCVTTVGTGHTDKKVLVGQFPSAVNSLSFSNSEESLLVSGEKYCAVGSAMSSGKHKKKKEELHPATTAPYMLPFRDSILGAYVIGKSKAVVVRRRWELIQTSLSDAIPRKIFGT